MLLALVLRALYQDLLKGSLNLCHNHSHIAVRLLGGHATSEEAALQFEMLQPLTIEVPTGLKYRLPTSTHLYVYVPHEVGLSLLEHLKTREVSESRYYMAISGLMDGIITQRALSSFSTNSQKQ